MYNVIKSGLVYDEHRIAMVNECAESYVQLCLVGGSEILSAWDCHENEMLTLAA